MKAKPTSVDVAKLPDGNVRLSFKIPGAKQIDVHHWDLPPEVALKVATYIRVALGLEAD